jgi:MFS family permease
MAPWFAATVVAGPLSVELGLTARETSWLTLAVQFGFVLGSVLSAVLLLADRWSARRLAAGASILAAAATAALTFCGPGDGSTALVLRALAGAALACVYPPAMKIAAGWTQRQRGTAIGLLVGAVTVGSAAPHLLRATWDVASWEPVLWLAAISALLGGAGFAMLVREGPFQAATTRFDAGAIGRVLGDRGVRLATAGYLGHMWELYAMWSTIGLFLGVMAGRHEAPGALVAPLSFLVIALGAVGSLVAGVGADRIGRARVTIIAMAASGACALLVGPVMAHSFPLGLLVAAIWGVTVVADSAQFSALVAEHASTEYVGTALTLQTASGFLLTMLTIHLVPGWAERWGWEWAYVPLAIGPLLGIAAMARFPVRRA